MLARLRPRLTYANLMATAAMFVALGGGALAATSFVGSDGQIHACVGKRRQLTVVKASEKCGKGKSKLTWNQQGPRGLKGKDGLNGTGQPGSPAASMLTGAFADAVYGTDLVTYASPSGRSTLGGASDVSMLSPATAVVGRDLSVTANVPNSTHHKVITLSVNGSDTALTCTIPDTATSCSDTTHAVVIPPSSTIALHYTYAISGGSGTLPDVRFGWRATTP